MVWLNQKLIQKILSVSHKPGVVLSHVTIWACNECKASAKSWVGERNSSLLRYNGNIWCTLQDGYNNYQCLPEMQRNTTSSPWGWHSDVLFRWPIFLQCWFFFFPTTRKLPIHSSNLFWKSNILEKEENSKLFKVLLRVSLKMQPIYALFYASSPIKHKNLSRC